MSAVVEDDDSGIPNLGFLRVVRPPAPCAPPRPLRPPPSSRTAPLFRLPRPALRAAARRAPCRAQIRLVRIFRVFKFGRYSLGLQMFVGCLKSSTQARALARCTPPARAAPPRAAPRRSAPTRSVHLGCRSLWASSPSSS